MSNYDYERFTGYEEQVIVGPEVVNGTGQVHLKFYEDDSEEAGSVLLMMPADDVLRLAEWLSGLAFKAMHAKWKEDHLSNG